MLTTGEGITAISPEKRLLNIIIKRPGLFSTQKTLKMTLEHLLPDTIIIAPASGFKYKIISHNKLKKGSVCYSYISKMEIFISWADNTPEFKVVSKQEADKLGLN